MKRLDGKYLEAITSSIEHSLIDNSTTRIERNKKIKDRDGIEREIDVYCETVVNGKKLKYGIECKQYTSKNVQLTHLVDFYSKIDTNGIKGIMITTSNYTKNTIKKAKGLGIDLFTIRKNPNPLIDQLVGVHHKYEIRQYLIKDPIIMQAQNVNLKNLYQGESKLPISSLKLKNEYLDKIAKRCIDKCKPEVFEDFKKITKRGLIFLTDEKRPYQFCISTNNLYYKHNGAFHSINEFVIIADIWIDTFNQTNPDSCVYYDLTNEIELANFFSSSIKLVDGIEGYINIVEIPKSKEVKFGFVTNDASHQSQIKVHNFGTYEQGEIEIKLTNEEE